MPEQTIPFQAQLVKKPAEGRVLVPPAGRIQWVGESDYWVAPECRGDPEFIMPLSEDSVLQVARSEHMREQLGVVAQTRVRDQPNTEAGVRPNGWVRGCPERRKAPKASSL